ncbi:hypothetical protein SD81_029855 [Tolypothrix campylonemoides VB511288]|nr:hypothetical protein SD81_029855 [Tolypothrix campylonemoides VB511288]
MLTVQASLYASKMVVYKDLSAYVEHPRHKIGSGSDTEDMQISIAVVEKLISQLLSTAEVLVS